MAEGKKSFVAYSDWRDTFNELTDEDAGKLIKHIFAYVNDEDPTSDSVVVKAVFAQIKNTLKRDLQKWEKQIKQRSEAGKKSAEVRATKSNERSTTANERQRKSTDSVSVSVSDNVNNNTIPSIEEFVAYGLANTPDVDEQALRLKYESWKVGGWKVNREGKEYDIKNWKRTLLNTLQYLPKQQTNKPLQKRIEDIQYEHIMKQIGK